MSDWIKIHRSIEGWEWAGDPVMFYFWVRILLMANWEDARYRGVTVERGTFFTSFRDLSDKLGLSLRQVRTCIDRLKSSGQIELKSTHSPTQLATQITICNYASYQDSAHSERHNKRHSSDTVETQLDKSPLTPPDSFPSHSPSLSPLISPQLFQEEEIKEGVSDDTPKKKAEPFSAPSDYDFVMVIWNSSARRSIPKVKAMSPARKEKVKLRVKEMGGWEKAKETLSECFKKIGESDFCNGATGKWVATFDWFFENEKNWMKVLEGNYDNRQEKSQLEVLAENIAKADAYYEQRYHGYGGASPYGNQKGGGAYGPDEQ